LLKYIEESGKYVAITGFRSAKIKEIAEFFKVIRKKAPSNADIQFFDAKLVATWQHLYFAVMNAETAFQNRQNISKTLAMETMIYASAQRQIRKAMELLGIKPVSSNIAVVIVGEEQKIVKSALTVVSKYVDAQEDETVLELSNEKARIIQKSFEISNVELKIMMKKGNLENALTDLVIERMALLATQH